ncbi:MAG: DUF6600 domain-containing protein [Ramlibacter sp.]
MSNPILKSAVLMAFTALSALAALPASADDPPARVGRVALAQGEVGIGGGVGAEMSPAQVNWPVTSGTMLTTARGARTELRVGSTAVRLDGDSSLEVIALDDDSLRLRLHYGSASVRIVNADQLRGFELVTPQARVQLQQPGKVRIDAERVRDTSTVSVFDGAALVDAGGAQLTVRAGKRADISDGDMRTASAIQDAFDSWSAARDRLDAHAASSRYVTTEMTGYEDLDRYGSWRTDSAYGPLWTPTVGADWVPYRDGSWTWIEPWGWTWVDNSPWGYAPFHYGRWVLVNHRWAWAPGRRAERLVWAPALVGWVGGAGWNVSFRDRSHRPGFGWYPLSPHDRYVPSYLASDRHLAWLNHHVQPDPPRGRDYRPQGLTVVPQDRFGSGGRVDVPKAPLAAVAPALVHNDRTLGALTSAPPAPSTRPYRGMHADRTDRERRIETAQAQPQQLTVQPQPPGTVPMPVPVRPQPVVSPTPHLPAAPQPVVSPTPHVAPTPRPLTTDTPVFASPSLLPGAQPQPRPDRRDWDEGRRERRDGDDWRRERHDGEDRRERRVAPTPAPVSAPAPAPAPVAAVAPPAPVQQAAVIMASQPAPRPMPEARAERAPRGDGERFREMPQRAAPPPPAPAPVAAAAPAAAAAPSRPAPARNDERKRGDEQGRQRER